MRQAFRVGDWLVEPDLNRISRSGKTVSVEPKVIEVLVFLASQPGQVQSKDAILRAVWPDTHVSDGILSYSISELRKALEDDARDPRFIQTIPRRGYRLLAPVLREASASAADLPSIAVLSFADMSREKDQEHFCDGIAEEIISRLSRVAGIRVAARTSAFAFKGKSEDVRIMGSKLGVKTVLEGSVRKAENRLRITAQLIHVEDGCHLWAGRYDREIKDVFAIQDEISLQIAETLQVALTQGEREAMSFLPPADLQAYEYYLRGKQFFYQYRRKGIEFALEMFSQAITLDPGYARAHAGMADCCTFLFMYAGSSEAHRSRADAASRKAIELDPSSAEAHASRGLALSCLRDYEGAEREFETAMRLNPRLFEACYFFARTAFAQGNAEKAIALYERANRVQPQDYQSPLLMAQIYDDLGRHDEARNSRRRGVRLVEDRLRLNPDDVRALYMGANGLVALGEAERGLEWARRAARMDPDEPMVLYNVACVQALAGRAEEAFETLESAVRHGLNQKGWIVHDSNLDAVRGHPRYPALIDYLDRQASPSS